MSIEIQNCSLNIKIFLIYVIFFFLSIYCDYKSSLRLCFAFLWILLWNNTGEYISKRAIKGLVDIRHAEIRHETWQKLYTERFWIHNFTSKYLHLGDVCWSELLNVTFMQSCNCTQFWLSLSKMCTPKQEKSWIFHHVYKFVFACFSTLVSDFFVVAILTFIAVLLTGVWGKY